MAISVVQVRTAGLVTDDLGWSLLLGFGLLVLASVDVAVFRLPDILTGPLAVLGLLHAVLSGETLADRAAGLVVGYAVIAGTAWLYARIRHRQGMGLGDAKLFAVAGAWLGWTPLPAVLLTGCGLGLAWVAVSMLRQGRQAVHMPIPFGAPLCGGIWLLWLTT